MRQQKPSLPTIELIAPLLLLVVTALLASCGAPAEAENQPASPSAQKPGAVAAKGGGEAPEHKGEVRSAEKARSAKAKLAKTQAGEGKVANAKVANTRGAKIKRVIHRARALPRARPVTVRIDHYAKAGDKLVFRFNQPMVSWAPRRLSRWAASRGRPVEITMDPVQRGSYRWTRPDVLTFTPARGALSYGQRVDVSVRQARPLGVRKNALQRPYRTRVHVPNFSAAGKVAVWPVRRGRPRMVALLDDWRQMVGQGPLYVLYDQPVSPRWVAKRARANAPAALAMRVFRPRSIRRVFAGKVDMRHIVAIRFVRLPAHGAMLSLSLPSMDGKKNRAKRTLQVNRQLKLQQVRLDASQPAAKGKAARAPLKASWTLVFSSPVRIREVKRRVRLSPQPKSIYINSWDNQVHISARLRPGTRYTLSVSPRLQDALGNPLAKGARHSYRSQDLEPHLELPGRAIALERGRAVIPLRSTNIGSIEGKLRFFRKTADFVRAVDKGALATCEDTELKPVAYNVRSKGSGKLNRKLARTLRLGGDAIFGFGCLELEAAGRGSEAEGKLAHSMLVQASGIGLTAKLSADTIMAWVTSLKTGRPLAGAKVSLFDRRGTLLQAGLSDKDGLLRLPGGSLLRRGGIVGRGYLTATRDGDGALLKLAANRVSQPWQYGLRGTTTGAQRLSAALFTERGVYRPGEKVHAKIVVRGADGRGLPRVNKVRARIEDPLGEAVLDRELTLDALGGVTLVHGLTGQARTGRYRLSISQGQSSHHASFRVEEYRVPTFKVALEASERWAVGKSVHAVVRARYLHGGDMAGRKVRYSLSRTPYAFEPPGFGAYIFSQAGLAMKTQVVASGAGRLDGASELGVSVAAGSTPSTMKYVLEVAVEDVDRQVQASRIRRVVHPADLYVGMRPPSRRVLSRGATLNVPLVVLSPKGQRIAGRRFQVYLEQLEYHSTARLGRGGHSPSVSLANQKVSKTAAHCRRISTMGPQSCRFSQLQAGHYRVRATARDDRGRSSASSFIITVAGNRAIAWPRFDHERIELATDRRNYLPGQVARLMVKSPFAKAQGLLTIERNGVLQTRPFFISKDSPVLRIPITRTHAPTIYASVILLRGRVHGRRDASGFETGAPAFRMGYAKLNVQDPSRRLHVQLKSDRKKAHPGQKVRVRLKVTAPGRGHAKASATVMVVDEAVLRLTAYRTPRPLRQLLFERTLGVRTASSRVGLPFARRARREAIFPGGGGGYEDSQSKGPAIRMRRLFKSTAFFHGDVAIVDGRADVEVSLPDNTTTYRVMAAVFDAAGRAGSAESRITVSKPLMVRAILPRFVHPDDILTIEAQVHNGTEQRQSVQVNSSVDGLINKEGKAQKTVVVAAGRSAKVSFRMKAVAGFQQAKVRFVARAKGHTDAVERSLPVLDPGATRKLLASRTIHGQGTLSVDLPRERVAGSTQLEVMVSSSRLSELKGAVNYLMGYPNGCIEQTTSRAYPLVILEDLLPEIGVDVDRKALSRYAKAGVKRLLGFQTDTGGLSYWPGGKRPHAFGTAFGLTALIAAKKRGYAIPSTALDNMARYLEGVLRQGKIRGEMPHGGMADGDTRAFIVMTLGRLGRPRAQRILELWQARDKLTAFGLSFLAVTIEETRRQRHLLPAVLAEVRRRAQEKPQEAFFQGKRARGWSMGSALRTHASALLAFARTAPRDSMGGKLLTGLLKRRRRGLWGNTQENVFGLMAVHSAVGSAKGKAPQVTLTVNGRRFAAARLAKVGRSGRKLLLEEKAGTLTIPAGKLRQTVRIHGSSSVPLLATLRVVYRAPLSGKTLRSHRRGFSIERRYETPQGKPLDPHRIRLGSIVRVRLTVKADRKQNYVAITDRLPAGLEPINSALATTARVRQGALNRELLLGMQRLSYREVRDSGVAFFVDEMPAGQLQFAYLARATIQGSFVRPAASVEAMYDPVAMGSSTIDHVTVRASRKKGRRTKRRGTAPGRVDRSSKRHARRFEEIVGC